MSHSKCGVSVTGPDGLAGPGVFRHDDAAALEAHRRQPEGTVHQLLTDDPEDADEVEAERNRQRMLAWRKKKGLA